MGLTYVAAEVSCQGDRCKKVNFLVDRGAGYSLFPREVWQELGLVAERSVTVVLADGTKLERDVSECKIALHGTKGTTPFLLGEPGDEPLLGVITLETLGFILDPYKRTIGPMKVRL